MESTPNPQTTPEGAYLGANTPNPEEPEERRRELGDTDHIADQHNPPGSELGGTVGEAIPAQIRQAKEFALNQGYEIADVYVDVGRAANRPAPTKLLEDAVQPDTPSEVNSPPPFSSNETPSTDA